MKNWIFLNEWSSANIYLFKVNNRNKRKRCEMCSKLQEDTRTTSLMTPERRRHYINKISITDLTIKYTVTLGDSIRTVSNDQFLWNEYDESFILDYVLVSFKIHLWSTTLRLFLTLLVLAGRFYIGKLHIECFFAD